MSTVESHQISRFFLSPPHFCKHILLRPFGSPFSSVRDSPPFVLHMDLQRSPRADDLWFLYNTYALNRPSESTRVLIFKVLQPHTVVICYLAFIIRDDPWWPTFCDSGVSACGIWMSWEPKGWDCYVLGSPVRVLPPHILVGVAVEFICSRMAPSVALMTSCVTEVACVLSLEWIQWGHVVDTHGKMHFQGKQYFFLVFWGMMDVCWASNICEEMKSWYRGLIYWK